MVSAANLAIIMQFTEIKKSTHLYQTQWNLFIFLYDSFHIFAHGIKTGLARSLFLHEKQRQFI